MKPNRTKVPKANQEEMAKYLLENGWIQSWSDDNWVHTSWKNQEANNGMQTILAYNLQYKLNNNMTYVTIR